MYFPSFRRYSKESLAIHIQIFMEDVQVPEENILPKVKGLKVGVGAAKLSRSGGIDSERQVRSDPSIGPWLGHLHCGSNHIRHAQLQSLKLNTKCRLS